jgi:DeoR/GlpR family transcriptional regulator of sugar metabolism
VAAKDRIQAIKQMVANDKKVVVSHLSSIFQVTRKLFAAILKSEDEGFLTRTYGGAVLNTTALSDNIHFYKRAKSFLKRNRPLPVMHYHLLRIKPLWLLIPAVRRWSY